MDQISKRTNLYRISDLPGDVIDQILFLLPLKEAVRTSTLSKRWEERWVTLPYIIIDKDVYTNKIWKKLEGFVNYILNRHEGNIKKFLVLVEVKDVYNVKAWISTLEKKGVEELFLLYHQSSKGNEVVPSILFSCQQLIKLSLLDCVVKLPHAAAHLSRGFRGLVNLELNKVNIGKAEFEELISSFPLLEQLTLRKMRFVDDHLNLQINVPKLKYFCFDGEFTSVCLNTQFLEIFDIDVYRYRKSKYNDLYYEKRSFDLKFNILGLPSTIQELYVRCEFPKYLAAFEEAFIPYSHHLRTLQLNKLCFEKVDQVRCLVTLIEDSVTTLDITACECRGKDVARISKRVKKFWKGNKRAHLMLNKLKKVRVRSFHGHDSEMKFIKYVMTNSPALEEMTIEYMENPTFDEDEVKRVLHLLCKTTTQLSFIHVVNHDESSSKDESDFKYPHSYSARTYEEDSD